MEKIDSQLQLKAALAANVAKDYTNAWAVVRDSLEKQNNLQPLADVMNRVLEVMETENVGMPGAVASICSDLEHEFSKLLVMGAGVEIVLRDLKIGQVVRVGWILERPKG